MCNKNRIDAYGYENTGPDEMMDLLVDQFLESAIFLDDKNAAGVRTQITQLVDLIRYQNAYPNF